LRGTGKRWPLCPGGVGRDRPVIGGGGEGGEGPVRGVEGKVGGNPSFRWEGFEVCGGREGMLLGVGGCLCLGRGSGNDGKDGCGGGRPSYGGER
jgi:hypothetical protein